ALLTDNKYFAPSDNFDYAVFKNDHILFQRSKFGQGEWPTSRDFENAKLYDEGLEKNDRHYYGVKTIDGRIILIISKKYERRTQLTNFSFYFLVVFFFISAMVLLSSLHKKRFKLNFTSKIQLYLGLAFIIPLFSTGFALLNSLNTSYKEEINRNYLKRSLYLSELLSGDLTTSSSVISSSRLADIRDIIQADISLYDSVGRLQATSQREIFDLKLQGEFINPLVYEELIKKENQSIITNESIGSLDYKVSYTILNDHSDKVRGFIATPFFNSKNHLNRQQLEVFGSLVTIFGFIFILAILFGNLILNNLMLPLRLVAEKISKVNLQEENKPILYESTDEIGSLVKDYNTMLVKLEESKTALARSQKETAWKEIAKQVAHEIKNPLTPMQLKIQQLLRKHTEGSKDHEILLALLTQVDNLSQIAGSFSAFAEMPVPNNNDFNLSKVIQQVVSLYRAGDVSIETNIVEESMIHADKDIFQRILNNIVLNAIQSVEGKQAKIYVTLHKKSGKCELSITDNGRGVPAALKDKIFMNYFSTKPKGSGIGLALAKKGIENVGGNIWFESKEGEGTTLYISMPLAVS
ncbi:MAG: ATP-binding protein, partial [Bacteroidota bacterium]